VRNAIVTGGAKGIGLGAVRELQAEGWRCAILDADPGGEQAAGEIGALFVRADVTDPASLRAAFE
jgi:NAD(P)-dependent dehydrogenase (short-subunit alcohol dehydrogenase family)